jgi:hypothetical protein
VSSQLGVDGSYEGTRSFPRTLLEGFALAIGDPQRGADTEQEKRNQDDERQEQQMRSKCHAA